MYYNSLSGLENFVVKGVDILRRLSQIDGTTECPVNISGLSVVGSFRILLSFRGVLRGGRGVSDRLGGGSTETTRILSVSVQSSTNVEGHGSLGVRSCARPGVELSTFGGTKATRPQSFGTELILRRRRIDTEVR